MHINGSGDRPQVEAAAGQAVGGGPPLSVVATASASSLPPPPPSASDAAVQPRSRDSGSPDDPPRSNATHHVGERDCVNDEDFSRFLDYLAAPSDGHNAGGGAAAATHIGTVTLDGMDEEDAPVPPAQIGPEDAVINELIKTPPNVEDVPMHPLQIATDFDSVDQAMQVPQIVKRIGATLDGLDEEDAPVPPARIGAHSERIAAAPHVEDVPMHPSQIASDFDCVNKAMQALHPPTRAVARASSPPPMDQGRSPSNPRGRQQTPVQPPPQFMTPSPDEDPRTPSVQVPILPSDSSTSTPMLEAILVGDQPEIPVYDAVQVAEQTRLEKNKKIIIGLGMGVLFGTAVTAGVTLSSNKPSSRPSIPSPRTEIPPPFLQPSLLPSPPPSTYLSTFDWSQQGTGFDGDAPGDFFGRAVAFSADAMTMAIGAPGPWVDKDRPLLRPPSQRPGYVKVYRREGEGSNWEQRGETILGETNDDYFGRSLSLSEDGMALFVGAPRHGSVGSNSGQVKVYSWDEAALDYLQIGDTLFGAASGDHFGRSLDFSNGILAVGAPYTYSDANDGDPGQITVYERDETSSNFKQRRVAIDGDAADDFFGISVSPANEGKQSATAVDWFRTSLSLSGNGQKLVAGAAWNGSNSPTPGQVRVFEWDVATLNYVQLGDSLLGDAAGDYFGWSVSCSSDGTTLAIGAPLNSENGQRSGQVKVFAWDEGASNFKQLGQSLFGKAAEHRFGSSVSLSSAGKTLAVGAPRIATGEPGYVEIYGWDEASSEYKRLGQSLGGEASRDGFGAVLTLAENGRSLAVGAPWNARNGTDTGRVEVFDVNSLFL